MSLSLPRHKQHARRPIASSSPSQNLLRCRRYTRQPPHPVLVELFLVCPRSRLHERRSSSPSGRATVQRRPPQHVPTRSHLFSAGNCCGEGSEPSSPGASPPPLARSRSRRESSLSDSPARQHTPRNFPTSSCKQRDRRA